MFDNLTDRLSRTFKSIRGQARLTEENMQQALRDVRLSLIEADVALPVIKEFIEQVKQKAVGQNVITQLKPDQAFVKIVHEELIHIMGDTRSELNFKTEPPAVFLMASARVRENHQCCQTGTVFKRNPKEKSNVSQYRYLSTCRY